MNVRSSAVPGSKDAVGVLKVLSAVLCCAMLDKAHAQVRADLIIHNANVHTLDAGRPRAQAVAVHGDRILQVGGNKEVLRLRDKGTRVIDAQSRTLIPGLFDSHLHVVRAGRFYHAELRWDGVRSLKRALAMLREQASVTPAGQWVRVVGGWNAHQFEEKRLPTLDEINAATGEVPTFILHLYGHAYMNRAGLRELAITSGTPNPPGALIEKDSNGDPTGLLIAEPNAYLLYATLARLPELSEAEKEQSTLAFMQELNRLGVTAVMDAGGGFQNYPDDYGITNALCERGALTVRLPYYLFAQKGGQEARDFTRWINTVEIGQGCDDHAHATEYHVQGGGENLVMSAADFENFDQPRPDLSPAMEDQLHEVLSTLVRNRWPFRLHATYDESITRFLNVIERVDRDVPLNGLLWFLDHCETVSEANLQRIKRLGGGIAVQHRMAYQGESFIRRYGMAAAQRTPPVKRMLELGIPVGLGTDGTRVASYNPWVALYWLSTGRTLGGMKHLADDAVLDRTTALGLLTQGSASLLRLNSDRGTITKGMLADMALLSEDYFTIPEERILDLTSCLTILDGRIVYSDGQLTGVDRTVHHPAPSWSPVPRFGGYQTH